MITNNGKQIIAKFLLDQAPTFATHIAAGSGARPLSVSASTQLSPDKKSLDFEVFRVPIIARGFINELDPITNNPIEKIVLKAEMPSNERYQITEVGLFPAETNALADRYDSKLLISFTNEEPWSYNFFLSSSAQVINSEDVVFNNTELDSLNSDSDIDDDFPDVAFIASDQKIFLNSFRSERYESPRYLNRSLLYKADLGIIEEDFSFGASASYIENNNISIDLSKNLPNDEIKLAFSLLSKNASNNVNPDKLRIILKFMNDVAENPSATANIELSEEDFLYDETKSNRYVVVTKKISEFSTSELFSWATVNKIRIYVSVENDTSEEYYVLLDSIRLDNVTTDNPLYAMVGYSVIKTENALPVLKKENTTNFIEYRFGIGVS
jgi:hypothetical protein